MHWPGWLWLAAAVIILTMAVFELRSLRRAALIAASPSDAWAAVVRWLLGAGMFGVILFFAYESRWQAAGGVAADRAAQAQGLEPLLRGDAALLQFAAAFFVEMALSLDNVVVIILLLAYYRVPIERAGRLIFWGSIVSLLPRIGLIFLFWWVLHGETWLPWLIGGLLALAALRVLLMADTRTDFDRSPAVRLVKRFVPVSKRAGVPGFITRGGKWPVLTPLGMVVLVAGIHDIMYTLDSVPALFAVTRDPLIAFISTVFSALSVRALYLALRGVIGRFRYLKLALVFVLLYLTYSVVFVRYDAGQTLTTLLVVVGIMAVFLGASLLRARMLRGATGPEVVAVVDAVRPKPIEDLAEAVLGTRRNLRKIVILIAGTFVVLFGALVVGPIPGPGGTVVVAAGIGLLATEFVWARNLLIKLKQQTEALAKKTDEAAKKMSIWVVLAVMAVYIVVAVGTYWLAARYFNPTVQFFIMMTWLGGSTAAGAWAGKSLFVIVREWRARRAARRAGAAPTAELPPQP